MKKEREMRELKKILKVKAKEKQRLLFFFQKNTISLSVLSST